MLGLHSRRDEVSAAPLFDNCMDTIIRFFFTKLKPKGRIFLGGFTEKQHATGCKNDFCIECKGSRRASFTCRQVPQMKEMPCASCSGEQVSASTISPKERPKTLVLHSFLIHIFFLNWQHQLCKNPRPNPDIKTLFVDHTYGQSNGALAPSPANTSLLSIPKAGGFPPLGAHGPFQPAPAPVPTPLAGWMSNPSTVAHPAVSGGAIALGATANPGESPPNMTAVAYLGQSHNTSFNADDLPKTVARTLSQVSSPMSMGFHPIQQTLLLEEFHQTLRGDCDETETLLFFNEEYNGYPCIDD